MNISLILNIVVILIGLIFLSGENTYKRRRAYMIICFGLFMFFNAFKSLYVGADTAGFYVDFCNYQSIPWDEAIERFKNRYFLWKGDFDEGYVIYVKLMHFITRDFIVFQLISSLLYLIPLGIIIMRFLKDFRQMMFAFVLYITLVYASGVMFSRQQMATVFLLWAFISIIDGKYYKAIMLNLIALVFHMSSIIFFVVIFFARYARNRLKLIHILSYLAIPVVIIYSSYIIHFAGSFLESDRYSNYGDVYAGGGFTFSFLMELLTVICYNGLDKETLKDDARLSKLYVMVPLTTIFAPFIIQDGVFFRLCKYFFLYMIILVPISIDKLLGTHQSNQGFSTLAYIISIGVLVVYSAFSTISYTFIWEIPYSHLIQCQN